MLKRLFKRCAKQHTDAGSEAASHGESRAYNLVVLTVAVTLLNIWVASSLPLWSHQIQRDKEAELIFRGMQYAEAIRVFQARYSRYPTRLKELIEVEPRCIRKLWENPMREDGRWGLVPVGLNVGQNVGAPGGGQLQNASPAGQPAGGFGEDERAGGDPLGDKEGGEGENGQKPGTLLSADPDDSFGAPPSSVPIRGVYAAVSKDAVKRFLGKENINEWQFTVELYGTQKQGGPANPSLLTPFMAWEIQANWPEGIVPQTPQPSSEPKQQQNQNGNNRNQNGNTRPDIRGPGAPPLPNPSTPSGGGKG